MIDRSVGINIGGEARKIKFTIQAIEELEAMLGYSVFDLMQKGRWSVTETIKAVYCGLKVYDRKLRYSTVEEWVSDYAQVVDEGMTDLYARCVACIGLSGLVGGQRSAFEDILTSLEEQEEASAGAEGKL